MRAPEQACPPHYQRKLRRPIPFATLATG